MSSVMPTDHPTPPADQAPPQEYYVPLPRRALLDLRDNALAVGVYALIIRVYRATRQPVPLSAADVAVFDPRVSYGAATRAIQRLIALEYLLPERERGRKSRYTPSWGTIAGTQRPFNLNEAGLGNPNRRGDLHLPQRLLDTYLGRLEPHPCHAAVATRYITRPLLTLADVGSYALVKAGLPADEVGLALRGLLRDNKLQAPPSDVELLSEVAAGRVLDNGLAVVLTEAGNALLERAATPQPAEFTPAAKPFTVPSNQIGGGIGEGIGGKIGDTIGGVVGGVVGEQIGGVIGGSIGRTRASDTPSRASESAKKRVSSEPSRSEGVESVHGRSTNQLVQADAANSGGGGGDSSEKAPDKPPTAAQKLLLNLGVRRDIAASLADRSPATVERVINEARAQSGIRNLAAWVVSALRTIPDTEPAPPPRKVTDKAILLHPHLTVRQRWDWVQRFRNTDPADKPALLARFHAEHPLEKPPTTVAEEAAKTAKDQASTPAVQ